MFIVFKSFNISVGLHNFLFTFQTYWEDLDNPTASFNQDNI